MVRWKLLVSVGLVVAFGVYSSSFARSASQPTAPTAPRTSDPPHCRLRFLAVRPLAHGTLPRRRTFTITGERYRFQCRLYFGLSISINRPGAPPGGGGGASFNPSQRPGVLAFTFIAECVRHRPYAVVFGLLRAPSNKVVALRGHRTTALQHVSIPGVLHARGVLVYAPLAGPPSELIVQRPDGKRVLDQKFPSIGRCPPGVVGVI